MMIKSPTEGAGVKDTITAFSSTFPQAVEVPSDTECLFGAATGEFTISLGTKGVASFLKCCLVQLLAQYEELVLIIFQLIWWSYLCSAQLNCADKALQKAEVQILG